MPQPVRDMNSRKTSIRETKRRMNEEHIELFHINGINSGVFVNLLHLPVKQVTTVHGNAMYDRIDKNILIQKLFVWLENTCLKRSHGIISVSASIKDLLVKRNGRVIVRDIWKNCNKKMRLRGIEPPHAAPEATALSTELQAH